MAKVIVTADSTCDLSPQLVQLYDIKILPLWVIVGEKSCRDCVDIFPADIFEYVSKTHKLPKTAALSVGEYAEVFRQYKQDGYDIVHISISSYFSSSYQNAVLAAEEFDNVYVVDSYNLSTGSGHIVLEAAMKAKEGKMSAKEIAEYVNLLVPKVDASFVVDTLEYLHKGGRCSAVAALGANILKLRPCIEVKSGKMGVGRKYRGKMKDVIKLYIEERLTQPGVKYVRNRAFVTHTCVTEGLADYACELVRQYDLFDEIIQTTAGCTVSAHCGPDTLGVLFLTE